MIETLRKTVTDAMINEAGLENFKKCSFFMSNREGWGGLGDYGPAD